ncbi:MAG: cytochrome P450 [Acidimicrobiales bacterium]|jgi:cytochrome P450|nr:cytochrome P450 [Acidimicrobiales bacterium]
MTDDTSPPDDIEVSDTGLALDGPPQEMYKFLRDHMPVMAVEHEMMTGTSVALHEDVMTVLQNPNIFSSLGAAEIGQVRPLIPLEIDPPDHSKFRKLLDPLFAPRRVAELEASTRSLVNDLIDAVIEDGACNFHSSIAEPLPSQVFLTMFGLPVERTAEFIELKDGIIRPPVEGIEAATEHRNITGQKIYAAIQEAIDEKKANPTGDFISQFLDAEVDGHRLTEDDVLDIGYLFFLAGLDTVTASLDCMLAYLAQNPADQRRLVEAPDDIPAAMEELLRWETPVAGVIRVATQDTELSGCPIRAGDKVSVNLGSANTDERFWDEADSVDFDREINKHIAFGGGIHRCLGSHLARMELRVGLQEWHKRVPSYELKPGTTPAYTMGLRSVDNLELIWET